MEKLANIAMMMPMPSASHAVLVGILRGRMRLP